MSKTTKKLKERIGRICQKERSLYSAIHQPMGKDTKARRDKVYSWVHVHRSTDKCKAEGE